MWNESYATNEKKTQKAKRRSRGLQYIHPLLIRGIKIVVVILKRLKRFHFVCKIVK